jgi:hypothetical protein
MHADRDAFPTRTALLAATALLALAGCQRYPYDPTKATRPYPIASRQERVADIQVIPNPGDGSIRLVNPTATSYRDFDLWVNKRYVRRVESLAAGETITLRIDSFWDERGEGPFPGGWFRYFAPTPIVLVQIQEKPDGPLVGLIAKPPDSPQR